MVEYFAKAVKAIEESEQAHDLSAFYQVKLSPHLKDGYTKKDSNAKFPAIHVFSGKLNGVE